MTNSGGNDRSDKSFDFLRLAVMLAVAFLCLTIGITSKHYNIFPSTLFERSFSGIDAMLERRARTKDVQESGDRRTKEEKITSARIGTNIWRPTRWKERGVTVHDPLRALQGFTIYCSGESEKALMINMDGKVVWEWGRPFNEVYNPPEQLAVLEKVYHELTSWREALLLENGNIITISETPTTTPYGLGLACLDLDSNVVWTSRGRYHHDVEKLPDGRFAALSQEFATNEKMKNIAGEELNYLVDYVEILSSGGEIEARIPLYDALLAEDWIHYYNIHGMKWWDSLHCNSIAYLTEEFAAHHDWAQEGQLLILARNQDLLFQLDWQNERVTWITILPFMQAHDPDPLENGNILVFDNRGGFPASGQTRVVEYNPATGSSTWRYEGTSDRQLDSFGRGVQQVLANGNVLINESAGGRILEVTREKDIVWEYLNPDRVTSAEGVEHIAMTCNPQRFTEEELPAALLKRIRE